MTIITAKMIGDDTTNNPFRVNLPAYSMIGEPNYQKKTCEVDVPDELLNKNKTRIDPVKLRNKYKGQPLWDRDDVAQDV